MSSNRRRKQQPSDAKIIAIIAGAIALDKSAQATAATLAPLIKIPEDTLKLVLLYALVAPISYGVTTLPSVSASAESSALVATYRAQYVLAAARRLEGLSGDDLQAALKRERAYFRTHLEAEKKRRAAASAVDKAKARYGDELGWYAKMDSRTSPECREANGRNFSASRIPGIGWPGAVHPFCRCKPGRKHATSLTVYGIAERKSA